MKKLLLIASLSIALISCGEKDPELPNPGIQGDVKLVDQIITSGSPYFDGTLTFEYDKSNRVTRIKMDYPGDPGIYSDIHYGNNQITITRQNEISELTEVATIESGNRIKGYNLSETYSGEIDLERVYNFVYDETNCLKTISYEEVDYREDSKVTTIGTNSFTWTDDNITEKKLVTDISDTLMGDQTQTLTYIETITYNEVGNNKTNLDLNWLQLNGHKLYDMFPMMGYFGKPCKNYISSMTYGDATRTIKYEFDTDGCPVKIDVYDNQSGQEKLDVSNIITYKK